MIMLFCKEFFVDFELRGKLNSFEIVCSIFRYLGTINFLWKILAEFLVVLKI